MFSGRVAEWQSGRDLPMVNIQFDRFLRLLDKARRVEMTKTGTVELRFIAFLYYLDYISRWRG
jgi:hypothetical protein